MPLLATVRPRLVWNLPPPMDQVLLVEAVTTQVTALQCGSCEGAAVAGQHCCAHQPREGHPQ